MDLIDQDYLHKLSKEELDWLNKFNKEYVSDSLDRDNLENNLHNTPKLKKDCGSRNNSRNRDVLTREKAAKTIIEYDNLRQDEAGHGKEDRLVLEDYEDRLIDKLDQKEIREAIGWLADELEKDGDELEEKLLSEFKNTEKESN